MKIRTENIPVKWKDLYSNHTMVKNRVVEKYQQLDDAALQQKIIEKYSNVRTCLGHEGYHYGGGLYFKMVLEDLYYHVEGLQVVVYIATQRGLNIQLVPESWVLRLDDDYSTCDDHEFCSNHEE